ncbi:hypothetical protein NHP200010_08980 [Helicobacter bizzozeronii]|uniref:hypothetical protein n=1 Tax=Helicobacter bizzozeronii TaxID=56877 RepID=UPI000CEF128D|nr:hypothetical protein [Helicobacter bizzozeronii]GMB93185.1 hypothetical protein NHP200010_08980 [Helicobacter bizzozeronii]
MIWSKRQNLATQKPNILANRHLLERLLLMGSEAGEVVLDPFLGNGHYSLSGQEITKALYRL